jgi:hypothetical protein
VHAWVNLRDIMRAAGFQQYGEAVIAKGFHQGQRIGLQERLSAGQLDERK